MGEAKFINRTEEFKNMLESVGKGQIFGYAEGDTNKRKETKQKKPTKTQFIQYATEISRDLQGTAQFVKMLAKKVQENKYGEETNTIKVKTIEMKEKLEHHKRDLKQLGVLLEQAKQNKQQQDQSQQHATTILQGLNCKLTYAANRFQKILKARTKNIKRQQKRAAQYGTTTTSFQPTQQVMPTYKPIDGGEQQQQQTAMVTEDKSSIDIIVERTTEIKNIEKEIVNLNTMFVQLAETVKMHAELTDRIDTNITAAEHNAKETQFQLSRYFQRISSNRGLILKMFFVLVIFLIIIGVVVIR
mmetsp:Transcript_12405/g.18550  ORF Transcript_12405/g.18550 Transcript_12405/m.18550 type:complete len:301 (+) Transcript_12405:54-956(+)